MAANTLPTRRARVRLRWLAMLGSALFAVTAVAGSASATVVKDPPVRNEPYAFDAWDCGYLMRVEGEQSHRVHVRTDRRVDGNYFYTDNYQWRETWTTEDGRSFTLSANGIFKDVQARRIKGTLYAFEFHENGQPFVITDSNGVVVYRDRGNLTGNYTFDFATGAFEWQGIQLHGPHPTFDVDLCHLVAPLTGVSDSSSHQTLRPIGSTPSSVGYAEYLPPSYEPNGEPSPLLLFFHGYGETGDGSPEAVDRLLAAGIPKYIDVDGWPTDRPFVVLSPQHVEEAPGFDFSSCDGATFGGSCNMQVQHDRGNVQPAFCTTPDEVNDFIDYAVANYNVDSSRVYLTGLSCGAFGIWEYLGKYAGSVKAAAAVPIAGDGRPAWSPDYCGLAETPLWAFTGLQDDTVDPDGSIVPLTELQDCPGVPADEAKLTTYPDRDHNSWDPAYGGADGADIYDWMLGFTNP